MTSLSSQRSQSTHERVEAAVSGERSGEVSRRLGVRDPHRAGAGLRGHARRPGGRGRAGSREGREGAALGEGGLHISRGVGVEKGEKGKGRVLLIPSL